MYFPRADTAIEVPIGAGTPASLDGSEVVLVVEDEGALRELLQQCLERHQMGQNEQAWDERSCNEAASC